MDDKIKSVDLLNRQAFVDRVIKIIELQSAQKKTYCFAINGKWGVGKSFVLSMLEEQLGEIQSEETATDKYMIFHYNCWQYDYYEEPLVAIVASMIDTIDEKERLVSEDTKKEIFEKVKGLLKIVGSALLIKASDEIEKKTGIDIKELAEFVSNTEEISTQKAEDLTAYDSNFLFKKTLTKLQQTIRILSKDKTIIFVVDELDRCLPEYAIKVLERLHHIFEGIENVQVILSIDKTQLEHIVKKTFGENTETQKYLSKFINFEVNLDEGSFSDSDELNDKFNYYIQNFEYSNEATKQYQVEEYITNIFDGVDMRSRIEIIEKANLLHKILNKEGDKSDFSTMCIEIFLVLSQHLRINKMQPLIDKTNMFENAENISKGMVYLNQKYQEEQNSGILLWFNQGERSGVRTDNLISLIFATYRIVAGYKKDFYDKSYAKYDFGEMKKYITNFIELLDVIN